MCRACLNIPPSKCACLSLIIRQAEPHCATVKDNPTISPLAVLVPCHLSLEAHVVELTLGLHTCRHVDEVQHRLVLASAHVSRNSCLYLWQEKLSGSLRHIDRNPSKNLPGCRRLAGDILADAEKSYCRARSYRPFARGGRARCASSEDLIDCASSRLKRVLRSRRAELAHMAGTILSEGECVYRLHGRFTSLHQTRARDVVSVQEVCEVQYARLL